jgi:hypothetical protein
MLADTTKYEKISKNPLPAMVKDIGELLCAMSQKYPGLDKMCMPHLPRLPEFYCTWKTHKPKFPPPVRPVTSQCDSPAERLSHMVTYILQKAVELIDCNIVNSTIFKQKISNIWQDKLTKDHTLFTADVSSLYTNVPLQHGHEVILKFIENNIAEIGRQMFGLELGDFSTILKTVVQSGYFRFDKDFYRQSDGLGMGVKPAPPYAILYVYCTVELPLLKNDFTYAPNAPRKPDGLPEVECWDRYVDDVFGIHTGEIEDTAALFRYINLLNHNIQFTVECSKDSVSFLDFNIIANFDESKLEFSLFVKPTSKDVFLNYNSCHPKNTILACARNELRRAVNNSSTATYRKESIDRISSMLQRNDYPDVVVKKLISQVLDDDKIEQKKIEQNSKIYYLILPYMDEQLCRKVFYILRKQGLLETTRVVFTPGRKLKDVLTKSSLHHTKCNKMNDTKCYQCDKQCMSKNICYQLMCSICQQHYLGETGRFKRNRIWEHYRSVINKDDKTAMGRHYKTHHATAVIGEQPFEVEVVKKCKDFVERQIAQSVFIKTRRPAINIQLAENNEEMRERGEWIKNTWKIY